MALKWSVVLVAVFIATVSAQSDTPQPMPTATMTPSMMVASPTPMATPAVTPPPQPIPDEVGQRFNLSLAEEVRSNHFYCLGAEGSREDFQNETIVMPYRWGLWIQYPVLSYLDTMRKRHLFYIISRLTGTNFFDNVCVAEVQHYGVSSYSESVFVKLYHRDRNQQALALYQQLNTTFINRYTENEAYIQSYLGRLAINVNSTVPSDGGPVLSNRTVFDSVLAGCDAEQCPDGDPTLLAVVLGSYVGRWYYEENGEREEVTVEHLMRGIDGYTRIQDFASNPNPINFGLEPGDIVFAVFGSIFLTILAGAIVIGFVIHPFFFA